MNIWWIHCTYMDVHRIDWRGKWEGIECVYISRNIHYMKQHKLIPKAYLCMFPSSLIFIKLPLYIYKDTNQHVWDTERSIMTLKVEDAVEKWLNVVLTCWFPLIFFPITELDSDILWNIKVPYSMKIIFSVEYMYVYINVYYWFLWTLISLNIWFKK